VYIEFAYSCSMRVAVENYVNTCECVWRVYCVYRYSSPVIASSYTWANHFM